RCRPAAYRHFGEVLVGKSAGRAPGPGGPGEGGLPIRVGLTWLLAVTTLHLTYASAFPWTRRRKNHDSQSQPTDRRRERPDQSCAPDRRFAAAGRAVHASSSA